MVTDKEQKEYEQRFLDDLDKCIEKTIGKISRVKASYLLWCTFLSIQFSSYDENTNIDSLIDGLAKDIKYKWSYIKSKAIRGI